MKRLFCLFVVALGLTIVVGQEVVNQIVDGPCSRFQVGNQQPFFKKLYTGTWYVYATYDYADIAGLDCLVAFHSLTPDGNVRNTERGKNLVTNARSSFQSTFYFTQPGVGHYLHDSTDATAENLQIPVIDYMNYFIEFSCSDLPDGKADCYIAAFTRTPFPGPIVVNLINAYFNAHNIDRTKLRYVNHDKTRCIF
ncbi:uncharacterized protein LOC119074529 [Bradysia coprophila]|uniref:uncharacterized protein LOC119074529 n=1 Tax=Bradysia coprophila TaxID=38358 RepID=UPI00187DD2DF|nr:uncharacterized protein LOC119074529 [Bradysia coprophila]